jgi:hypothetical protein
MLPFNWLNSTGVYLTFSFFFFFLLNEIFPIRLLYTQHSARVHREKKKVDRLGDRPKCCSSTLARLRVLSLKARENEGLCGHCLKLADFSIEHGHPQIGKWAAATEKERKEKNGLLFTSASTASTTADIRWKEPSGSNNSHR